MGAISQGLNLFADRLHFFLRGLRLHDDQHRKLLILLNVNLSLEHGARGTKVRRARGRRGPAGRGTKVIGQKVEANRSTGSGLHKNLAPARNFGGGDGSMQM
jgi:hypothetical protein